MIEIWKKITGCSSHSVSNFGRIRNDVSGKMRKITHRIYSGISITTDEGIRKNFLVHRLVAIEFIPNPDNLPEVNHKNGKRDNNFQSNLEWVTTSDNQKHAIRTGLKLVHHENHPGAKITMEIAREIRRLKSLGMSRPRIVKKTGISNSIVSHVIYNRAWIEKGE